MKKIFQFNKLIRDKLHKKMMQRGAEVLCKPIKDRKELLHYFKKKIVEEAFEVESSKDKEELTEECADLIETVYEMLHLLDIPLQQLETVRMQKKAEKGGFADHVVVHQVTVDEESDFAQYYRTRPEKYPELQER